MKKKTVICKNILGLEVDKINTLFINEIYSISGGIPNVELPTCLKPSSGLKEASFYIVLPQFIDRNGQSYINNFLSFEKEKISMKGGDQF